MALLPNQKNQPLQPAAKTGAPLGQQQKTPQTVPTGAAPGVTTANPQAGQALLPSQRAAQIAKKGGALFDLASTTGEQMAQKRGLLNSSLAAGAASREVVAQAAALGQADADADYRNRALAADTDIRTKALAQTKDLETRRMDIDEKIRTFQNNLDQRRLESDEAYRTKALAQQAALERERMKLTKDLEESKLALSEKRLDLDAELGRGDLNLRERLGLKGLGIEEQKLALDTKIKEFYADLDRDRFRADEVYRDEQLAHEQKLLDLRKEIHKDTMTLEQKKHDLNQAKFDFYSELDLAKFNADEAYRNAVLSQQLGIANQQAELTREKIAAETGISEDRMSAGDRAAYGQATLAIAESFETQVRALIQQKMAMIGSRGEGREEAQRWFDEAYKGLEASYQKKMEKTAKIFGMDLADVDTTPPDVDVDTDTTPDDTPPADETPDQPPAPDAGTPASASLPTTMKKGGSEYSKVKHLPGTGYVVFGRVFSDNADGTKAAMAYKEWVDAGNTPVTGDAPAGGGEAGDQPAGPPDGEGASYGAQRRTKDGQMWRWTKGKDGKPDRWVKSS